MKEIVNQAGSIIQKLSKCLIMLIFLANRVSAANQGDKVIVYPAPPTDIISQEYEVIVNGKKVPVIFQSHAEGMRFFSYVQFDFAGKVHIEIRFLKRDIPSKYRLGPKSYQLNEKVKGRTISFTIDRPRQIALHYGYRWGILDGEGLTEQLFIFANPVQDQVPKPGDPGVIDIDGRNVDNTGNSFVSAQIQEAINDLTDGGTLYIGPGTYNLDAHLSMKSNTTLYLAGGALLRVTTQNLGSGGAIGFNNVNNAQLRGRGSINVNGHNFRTKYGFKTAQIVRISNSQNIIIEGVVLLDCANIHIYSNPRVNNSLIYNAKLVSDGNFSNSDGVDHNNDCFNNVVDFCFIHAGDDCIAPAGYDNSIADLIVRNCVMWNKGTGSIFKQWSPNSGGEGAQLMNYTYENNDAIFAPMLWSFIINGSYKMHNVWLKNFRVDERNLETGDNSAGVGTGTWVMSAPDNSEIYNIHFINIFHNGIRNRKVDRRISGNIHNIEFTNYFIDGKHITSFDQAHVSVSGNIRDISWNRADVSEVEVSATDLYASEKGKKGEFTITRTGGSIDKSLEIPIWIHGSAKNGEDFQKIQDTVIIPAGYRSITIPVRPIKDKITEGLETVLLSLKNQYLAADWMIGPGFHAQISIVD
ncbi:MAG: Calx-beta domain-containing protein [Bacteroidales bacterium]